MRIGFDAKRATHNSRGLGNYSRGLIEGLIEYFPTDKLLLYSPQIKNIVGQEWINSIADKVILKTPQTLLENKLSALWRSFLMISEIKNDQLDIFHGLSHEIPFGFKGAKSFKKIVTMHDLIFIRYPEFFPLIDRMVYLQKFKYACKHSDVVIAICEQTRDDLIQFLGVDEKKILVHYQSCAPLFYQIQDRANIEAITEKYKITKPFILHVGAFEERKNQLSLLLAYAKIADKIEEDLVFIGQGKKYKEKLQEQIIRLKLNHRVHILDTVKFDELPCLYQAASVFCFPSLFEGFGIPLVEALFSKTPVITSIGSCFPESAGPDSIYIDPLSESSIAEGLLKVLNDKKLQSKMSSKGYDFVQRFHRQQSSNALKIIYQNTLV